MIVFTLLYFFPEIKNQEYSRFLLQYVNKRLS